MGFDERVVSDVIWKVDHTEYKRQQAPMGIKITPKAFGFGRTAMLVGIHSCKTFTLNLAISSRMST
ncbi:MAG: hypothetical protein QMD22_00515, partial [archaeon]|nr:hypothetical protein [archaeon]